MRERRWHLRITEPLPGVREVAELNLSGAVTTLRTSTALPGGYAEMTVDLARSVALSRDFWPAMTAIDGFQHVELSVNGVIVWAGRVLKPILTGGVPTGLRAIGYGEAAMKDHIFYNTDATDSTSGAVLTRVVGQSAPLLGVSADPQLFVDPGIKHNAAEYDGLYPWDIVSGMSTEGGSGQVTAGSGPGSPPSAESNQNAPYDWSVWEDRIGHLIPRTAPPNWNRISPGAQGATYLIDADATTDLQPDFTDAYGSVTVEFTPPNGLLQRVGPFTDATFVDRYGFQRDTKISVSPMSNAQATAIGKTYLALHSQPIMPVTITRKAGAGLRLARGGEQDPGLTRAGEYVQVADRGPFCILATEMDWIAEDSTVTAQAYPPGYWQRLRTLEGITRAYARGLNAFTIKPDPQPQGIFSFYLAGSGAPIGYESYVVPRDDAIWFYNGVSWKSSPLS